MLEKQWNLAPKTDKKIEVTCSGTSARRRRIDSRRKVVRSIISPQLVHNTLKGYVKGVVSEQLLTHAEVVQLSHKIKAGLALEDRRSRYPNLSLSLSLPSSSTIAFEMLEFNFMKCMWFGGIRLKQRLGCEPSDEQLATSLRITRANLQTRLIECSLAREKLAMSNIRLVMSIAQRYDNLGAEMPDLVQVVPHLNYSCYTFVCACFWFFVRLEDVMLISFV